MALVLKALRRPTQSTRLLIDGIDHPKKLGGPLRLALVDSYARQTGQALRHTGTVIDLLLEQERLAKEALAVVALIEGEQRIGEIVHNRREIDLDPRFLHLRQRFAIEFSRAGRVALHASNIAEPVERGGDAIGLF